LIDLYAAPTSNGVRAKIMLDECGLPYTLHRMNLQAGDHKKPEYLKLNPVGAIPTIVDSDGPGGKPVTTAQSVAILIYLAEKSGKFIPRDPVKRVALNEALFNVAVDISGALAAAFTLNRAKEPHKPSIDAFGARYTDYLKIWEAKLAKQKYCMGDEVTIVDLALFGVVQRGNQVMPQLTEGLTHFNRWTADIAARPGVKKGLDFG
jgi:GST-like protein